MKILQLDSVEHVRAFQCDKCGSILVLEKGDHARVTATHTDDDRRSYDTVRESVKCLKCGGFVFVDLYDWPCTDGRKNCRAKKGGA